jgi:broad-specificity NMP kinase
MAGSPGAGKTEVSQELVRLNLRRDPPRKFVRLDADEIRAIIPGYTGGNAHEVQSAAAVGMERLFDAVQDHRQHAIVDGTFTNYDKSRQNVHRAVGKGLKS